MSGDDNDVTYFIIHLLEVNKRAINELLEYLQRKGSALQTIEELIRKSRELQRLLNHRQIAALNRALKKPESIFYIESHRGSHNVTYDTARTDLLKLVKLGLLTQTKIGKAYVFSVPEKLM